MDTTQFKYLVLCAHGEIRTHTNWGLKPGPLPIGLRERNAQLKRAFQDTVLPVAISRSASATVSVKSIPVPPQ